jgi:SAM-dependent methyltransferase
MTNESNAMNTYQYNCIDNYYHPTSSNEFAYRDSGDSENKLYKVIRNAKDKSVFSREISSQASDWPSFYHLTPLRSNIVRPFAKDIAKGRTLELGAGCGAITRFLGELGGEVVAIEGSPERARIIGNRCADLKNVTVIADLIQNYSTPEKFDVVTLIGVLEYSQVYIASEDPIQSLIEIAKSFLNDNGLLIIAIENQLGLKYFCGAPEDHLGRPMFGINDSYTEKSAITFGRKELTQHIQRAGFGSIELYVPIPDYKTPVSIIYPKGFEEASIAAGWDAAPILSGSVVHDRQRPGAPTFSLESAWGVVSRNGLAQDLANSFLFAIRATPPLIKENILAAHYGCERPAQFAKETQITLDEGVLSTQTKPAGDTGRLTMEPWIQSPYRTGKLWFDELLLIMNRPGWSFSELSQWAGVWITALQQTPLQAPDSTIPELRHFSVLLPANYIDATPTNFIVSKTGHGDFFDLEWNFSTTLPIEFIVLRGLFLTLHRVTSCMRPSSDVPVKLFDLTTTIMQQHGMTISPDDLDLFLAIFNAFQNQTQDAPSNALNGLTAQLESATLPIRQLFA